MLWACILLPQLAFDAVFCDAPDDTRPRVLVEGPQQRPAIARADARARAMGIRAGQPLAAARALCPHIHARPRDVDAERRLLDARAGWAYQYSGQVSLAGASALYVEVGASLTLFGGWPALERRMRSDLIALSSAHRIAVAPIAAGARVLAGCDDGLAVLNSQQLVTALGAVPLARSTLRRDTVLALSSMGFRNLRELFRLPRPELARRIGTDALDALDRMRGEIGEALIAFRPADKFEHRIELEGHIESWQPLLFPLQRLARELAAFLAGRDGGVERFEIRLEHEDRAATRIPVGLLAPQREANALFEFARGRLERAEIATEISAIALVATDLPTFRPLHRDLFEASRQEKLDWPALAERLRARLGDDAVSRLAVVADHRPERAVVRSTALEAETKRTEPAAPSKTKSRGVVASIRGQSDNATLVAPPARPFWLLARPIPLRMRPTRLLAGPERIESGWWDDDVRRDYYVVETSTGQRAWAYRPPGDADGWMLHGWFA